MEIDYTKLVQVALPAFMGAFFAFLFIKLSEVLRDLSKRKLENYDALVKIDIMTNEIYEQLNVLIFDLEQIGSHYKEAKEKNFDMFSYNKPKMITFDKSVLLDLLNIDFSNELFSFFTHIEKHNSDINSLNEFKDSFQKARLEEKITSDNFMKNMEKFTSQINEFKKFCVDLQNDTLDISASCRVLMNSEMSWSMKIKNILLQKRFKKKHSKNKVKELELIKKEIETIKKESQEKIDKTLNS